MVGVVLLRPFSDDVDFLRNGVVGSSGAKGLLVDVTLDVARGISLISIAVDCRVRDTLNMFVWLFAQFFSREAVGGNWVCV